MTTIVYKDGILASDTMISVGDKSFGKTKKIFDLGDKVIGIAGNTMLYSQFLKFLQGEVFDKELFSKTDLHLHAIVIIKETKEILFYDNYLAEEKNLKSDFFALGSGADIAKGALAMGATPRQAIEIAAKFDHGTNNEIDEIKL